MIEVQRVKPPWWAIVAMASAACGRGGNGVAPMGIGYEATLVSPPDNVVVSSGTWGVDFDQSESVLLSDIRSIWFKPTQPAEDPSIEFEEGFSVTAGDPYTAEVVWLADSVRAGDTMLAEVRWYDCDDTYMTSSTIYSAAVLSAIDTWYTARASVDAPPNARFARVRVTKNNTQFSAYLDQWDIEPSIISGLFGYTAGTQSIPTGVTTTALCDTTVRNNGFDFDPSTGIVTILKAGVYSVQTYAVLSSLDNGAYMRTYYGSGVGSVVSGAPQYNWSGAALTLSAIGFGIGVFSAGTEITGRILHTSAGAEALLTYSLNIVRLE